MTGDSREDLGWRPTAGTVPKAMTSTEADSDQNERSDPSLHCRGPETVDDVEGLVWYLEARKVSRTDMESNELERPTRGRLVLR